MTSKMDMQWLEHQVRTCPKKDRPVINWTCLACTFINRSYIDECEMCDTKQVLIKDTAKIDGGRSQNTS